MTLIRGWAGVMVAMISLVVGCAEQPLRPPHSDATVIEDARSLADDAGGVIEDARPLADGAGAVLDGAPSVDQGASPSLSRIALPPAGKLYHGVFPGGISGAEDDFTEAMLDAYEQTVGLPVAWVYFSHNWFTVADRAFPTTMATWIRAHGAVPFIRLMLRSKLSGADEPVYTLQAIIDGNFDEDLTRWGQAARAFGSALLVEYGAEVNGDWEPWNGIVNGKDTTDGFGDPTVPDGPERFVAAYRHIIELIRATEANNISWVFHIQCGDWPEESWNRFEGYYPGDSYVDWVGLSQYGALTPDSSVQDFVSRVDACYPRLTALAPGKPVAVLEFGSTAGHPTLPAESFAHDALEAILGNRWPALRAFSWWNEKWENLGAAPTDMQVQNTPALGQAFAEALSNHAARIQSQPLYE